MFIAAIHSFQRHFQLQNDEQWESCGGVIQECSCHKELHICLQESWVLGVHFNNRSSWYSTNKCGDLGFWVLCEIDSTYSDQTKCGGWKSWKLKRTYEILFLRVYYFQYLWHHDMWGLTQNGTEMEGKLCTKIMY